ncbi:hypothetical protein VSWAT3_25769 [Vibrionales bacterium SWAT-3]|nr:hypothetical protein VSWAT3_25769 [Vibrionales bacterium SWAT-3]
MLNRDNATTDNDFFIFINNQQIRGNEGETIAKTFEKHLTFPKSFSNIKQERKYILLILKDITVSIFLVMHSISSYTRTSA